MKELILTFNIQSDWHIGSGEEGGAYADALVVKDTKGLPYIPGKSVKGLLRDAYQKAVKNKWFGNDTQVDDIFGSEGGELETQSKVAVSSAELSLGEQAFLESHPSLKAKLYRVLHHTAIDQKTGVAKNMSLRATEVAIPMTLVATVQMIGSEDDSILESIGQAAMLIQGLGAKRNRGLGEVIVSYKVAQQERV